MNNEPGSSRTRSGINRNDNSQYNIQRNRLNLFFYLSLESLSKGFSSSSDPHADIRFLADRNYRLLLYRVIVFVKRISLSSPLLNRAGEKGIIMVIMEARQVFKDYDQHDQSPSETYRFCPRCGASLRLVSHGNQSRHHCSQCGYVLYQNPSPGVVVLLVDNDRVLLGKRAGTVYRGGAWSLPGGFIEFDEDFLSAAHREVMEETGLIMVIQSLFSVVSNFFEPHLHTLVIVLVADVIGGGLSPGDDMVELGWWPLSGPLPDMAFSADIHVIERYHKTKIPGAPIDPRFATAGKR